MKSNSLPGFQKVTPSPLEAKNGFTYLPRHPPALSLVACQRDWPIFGQVERNSNIQKEIRNEVPSSS